MAFNYIAPLANGGVVTTEANRRALGLKLWSGEVLNAYTEKLVTGGKVRKVSINEGTSYQFPVTSKVKGGFAKPGVALAQDTTIQKERTITIDDIMYASIFFPLQYDLVGHLNTRSEYSKQAGNVLARSEDIMNFCNIRKAANTAAIIAGDSGHSAGSVITSDLFKNDGGTAGASDDNEVAMAIFNALFAAAELYDDKDIPEGQRYCVLRPHEYYILIRAIQSGGFALSNKDYMSQPANLNQPGLPPVAGFDIIKSTLLPRTNLTGTGASSDTDPNTLVSSPLHVNHETDFRKTVGLIWTPECVGSVVKQGIATKMEDQLTHLGQLLVSYMLVGGGVLRPDSAIELELDTLSN